MLKISYLRSRKNTIPVTKDTTWDDFVSSDKFTSPKTLNMSLDEYLALSKEQQDNLKDTGGYIAGICLGGRNKPQIKSKPLITLDFDHIEGNELDFRNNLDSLGVTYLLHSTLKSTKNDPRYRVLIPIDREIVGDDWVEIEKMYKAVSKRVAEQIGMDYVDSTTFDINRLMFFPAKLTDTDYIYEVNEGEVVNVDKVLDSYNDWRDEFEWPTKKEEITKEVREFTDLSDPTTRPAWVGAFCRVYDIHEAIEEFLQAHYIPFKSNRYTYISASGVGGAIVYQGGSFLYSRHESDPANNGHCFNSYDLVKLHIWDNDEIKMQKMCEELKDVKLEYLKAGEGVATIEDFEELEPLEYFGEKEGPLTVKDVITFLYQIDGDTLIRLYKTIKPVHSELSNILKALYKEFNMKTKKEVELESKILRSTAKSNMIKIEPRKHIVDKIIVENRTTLISAMRGVGKTTFVGEVVQGALSGGAFMGGAFRFEKATKCLVVISEGEPQDIKEKTDIYNKNFSYPILNTYGLTPEEIRDGIIDVYIKGQGIKLVIFDSFSLLISRLPNFESNSNDAAIKAQDMFCVPLNQAGASVLITMHMSNKGNSNSTRGASAIEDLAAHVYYYKQVTNDENEVVGTKLEHSKSRIGSYNETQFFSLDGSGKVIVNGKIKELDGNKGSKTQEPKETLEEKEERLLAIIEALEDESGIGVCMMTDAAERLGVAFSTLDNKVRDNFTKVEKVGKGKNAMLQRVNN